MNTIMVDDEPWSMKLFEKRCSDIAGINMVGFFSTPTKALEYASENEVNCALLDIEMPVMSGLELGKKLRSINPDMILIFVTAYDKYLHEAILDLKADNYILKPFSKEQVEITLKKAVALSEANKKDIYVKTFGQFDLYVNGNVVSFTNAKAKELFALCIDKLGGEVTMGYIIDNLWGERLYDENTKRLYRKAIISLRKLFEGLGVPEVFESGRAVCHVNMNKFKCDYFDFVESNGKNGADINDYMPDYSWGEWTIGRYTTQAE